MAEEIQFAPQPGPQTLAAASTVYELLYGGAKGGGKTMWAVQAPARYAEIPRFRALTLRRESKDLGDILDKSREIYPACFDCRFLANHPLYPPHWSFASGAMIALSHVHDEEDWQKYEGQEYQWITFDELTHYTERQYLKILQRLRGIVPGLPSYVRYARSTATPDGRHKGWVKRRFGPWLSRKFEHPNLPPRYHPITREPLPPASSGQVLWFRRNDHGDDEIVPAGTKGARSRSVILARLSDNKILERADPGYRELLESLDPHSRAIALEGDWDHEAARGDMFPRDRWLLCHSPPSRVIIAVRFIDLSASEDGDYCSATLIGLCEHGEIVILHQERKRGGPDEIDDFVTSVIANDESTTICRIEQEPGSAGKLTVNGFINKFPGRDIQGVPEAGKGTKVMRARPFSSMQRHKKIYAIAAPWNEDFFGEAEDFPIGEFDDQVDSASGAFNALCALRDFVDHFKNHRNLAVREKALAEAFDRSGLRNLKGL